jgi:hypothetical protein
MGRPHKFGEPTVKKEVRLPESLSGKLTESAIQQRMDMSDVFREALECYINGVAFKLPAGEDEDLAEIAESMGFDDTNAFARLLIRRALDRSPNVIREFLYGDIDREVEAVIEAENNELAKEGIAEFKKQNTEADKKRATRKSKREAA